MSANGSVDALEAVIQWMRRDADMNTLTGGRVANKHKFGDGWDIPSKAIALRYDGGPADIDTTRQTPRLEARLYGESPVECSKVYRRLVALTRACEREVIETTDGKALIYWLLPESAPSQLYDPELKCDYFLLFLTTAVAEVDVV